MLSKDKVEGVARTLDAIVALAQASPFNAVTDLAVKQVMKDQTSDFDFGVLSSANADRTGEALRRPAGDVIAIA